MLFFDGEQVKTGKFPNKETYVDIDFIQEIRCKGGCDSEHIVRLQFEGNDDTVNLIFLKRLLDDAGFTNVILIADYFPYSTMDRTEDLRSLSCKYFSEVINSLGFKRVYTKEAHSAVVLATLDRVTNDECSSFKVAKEAIYNLVNANISIQDILIVFPDVGAEKRYGRMFDITAVNNSFHDWFATATLAKTRDFTTGKITGMKFVEGEENVKSGKTAIIIDDLCRGGRTFVGAGKALKAKGIERVILCVTHMEDSVFSGPMLDGNEVDEVYAHNTCVFSGQTHLKLHFVVQ